MRRDGQVGIVQVGPRQQRVVVQHLLKVRHDREEQRVAGQEREEQPALDEDDQAADPEQLGAELLAGPRDGPRVTAADGLDRELAQLAAYRVDRDERVVVLVNISTNDNHGVVSFT